MSLTAVLASEAAIKNSCVQVASDHEVSVCGGVEGLDVLVVMQRQVLVMQKVQRTVDVPLVQYI